VGIPSLLVLHKIGLFLEKCFGQDILEQGGMVSQTSILVGGTGMQPANDQVTAWGRGVAAGRRRR